MTDQLARMNPNAAPETIRDATADVSTAHLTADRLVRTEMAAGA